MNKTQVSVVFFQHDLRIDDQWSLAAAKASGLPIVGIYVFPNSLTEKTEWGFLRASKFRLQFLWDSLLDLKANLSTLNIPLYLWTEQSASFPNWIQRFEVKHLFASVEPGREEIDLRTRWLKLLGNPPFTLVHDKPLCSPQQYPWLLSQLPERFTDARIKIEQNLLTPTLKAPLTGQLKLDGIDDDSQLISAKMPTLSTFMKGGETSAKQHLHHYFFTSKKILTYKETRNNMLAFEDSSKLSPALSLGLLSPRRIDIALKKVEAENGKNASTYWLWFELLWRDYFYYLHLKHGNTFFMQTGIKHIKLPWLYTKPFIDAILQAKTGYPLVDANLIELYQTGWMSNRGRQNVASFISKILRLDWRFGASLFEHYLCDYDVSSNYGNWQYISGVGVDPREDRVFNVSLQAKRYDPTGAYLKHWLPPLRNVPIPLVFEPWNMNGLEMSMYGCDIGKDYPHPVIKDARVQLKD